MKSALKPLLAAAVLVMAPAVALAQDVTGEWTISSSAGTASVPVHCTLLQRGESLYGLCAAAGEQSGSLFQGSVNGDHATWGYDVTVDGRPSHVAFQADVTDSQVMKGDLTLSGQSIPFTATMEH